MGETLKQWRLQRALGEFWVGGRERIQALGGKILVTSQGSFDLPGWAVYMADGEITGWGHMTRYYNLTRDGRIKARLRDPFVFASREEAIKAVEKIIFYEK